jgi:hypothetical protein
MELAVERLLLQDEDGLGDSRREPKFEVGFGLDLAN